MNDFHRNVGHLAFAAAAVFFVALVMLPNTANSGTRKKLSPPYVSDSVVKEWNEIAFTTIGFQPGPMNGSRFMTIVQLAVFEAVNATTGRYEPYLGTISAPEGASAEAAAVMAAHDVLVNLFPGQAAVLNQRRDQSLATIPDGQAKIDGIGVGMAAAAAMLSDRTNDGSSPPLFHLPDNSDPYEWQTYTGCPAGGGAFRHWPNVRPFALESGSQFLSNAPPHLWTGKYATDFIELQRFGDVNSVERSPDRTNVARLFAVAVPPTLWNSALLQIINGRNDEITDTARIMAVLNMAIVDGSIAVFDTKYHYRTWRPITAIPRADEDGNRRTTAGPFTPLVATPCFPSYPSAHATLSNAALTVLGQAYGESGHSINISHPAVPGVTFHYSKLKTILEDISDARVYGGIHFRYDQESGELQGQAVGQFVYNNLLIRKRR